MSWCIRELLVFREFISKRVVLFCTPYIREASILCWQHKNNKPHSIYRNIKSQDGFYMKQQRIMQREYNSKTVLYRFSTSNHNKLVIFPVDKTVVLYRFSTSNHNHARGIFSFVTVVLYRFSTSNHNSLVWSTTSSKLYYIGSLHQTTTHHSSS